MNWLVEPSSIRELLTRVVHPVSGDLPVYITENGSSWHDYVTPDGQVHDHERDGRAWRYRPAATREAYVTELMLTALDQTGDRSAALARFAKSVSGDEASALRGALDEIEGGGGG